MFSCCCQEAKTQSTELIKPEQLFGGDEADQELDSAENLFAMYDKQVDAKGPRSKAQEGRYTPNGSTSTASGDSKSNNMSSRQTSDGLFGQTGAQPRFQRWSEKDDTPQSMYDDNTRRASVVGDHFSKEERLQNAVRDFQVAAHTGIKVELIDVETKLLTQGVLKVDGRIERMTLQQAFQDERTFNMSGLRGVIKGAEFRQKVPLLQHISPKCLGMEFHTAYEDDPLYLHFRDTAARDEFYTCLKVLKMCSENLASGRA